ncbi:alanine--tRNA ligase [Dendrosporobacter sp. 1207_IL3150]|uniref:alanine--tRNA ligase n=1 Tax=Dendrosporobacter sp. 1207_IL3150 TaxID=3084054 RepID=UPI002FD98524
MIYMSGNQLRQKFLDFFASKNHLILPSYSLVPENDPTLLMIGAGMAPFKPFFTGKLKPPHPRISTSQKCVRTGDIENVGRTARHHTFFEMLGNFSFGDYFKREAITWAWEFITVHLEIPVEKLWVTTYPTDDEAFEIWEKEIGVSPSRIIKMEDNFWEIGPGPCGPCSEIYVDLGEERGCGSPDCAIGCDCDRYLEIWNLVFTQFDRDEEGNYKPLEKKNIDTGAGLERIASVLQNKKSNFETDLLFPIIEYAASISGVGYGNSSNSDVSMKVIADHARSMTVMISDGILPSNEGRGYVLRRIIRRAIRHGRLLGIEKTFLVNAVDVVVNMFAEPYPELQQKKEYIRKVVQLEEERFQATLAQGIELLNKHIKELEQNNQKILSGASAFKLYDTFGFPWELTAEILSEYGMELDKLSFDQAMNEQRERARAARQENERVSIPDLTGLETENLVYNTKTEKASVIRMWKGGQLVDEAHDGEEASVIFDATAFYAEGGGQVGDSGLVEGPLGKMSITSAKKLPNGTIYHIGYIEEGIIKVGDTVKLAVDTGRRIATARNHTATHLLHSAMKNVLGSHVNQAGSSVGPDRLRFDFSHFTPVTDEQLLEIEEYVNNIIFESIPVNIMEVSQDEAKKIGATALFGEKYGEIVRVVCVDECSKELCGGTHVANTAEIGLFKIISESGVASGVRRIEAVTGRGAINYLNNREKLLIDAADAIKTRPEEIVSRVESLLNNVKELELSLNESNAKLAKIEVQKLFDTLQVVNGVQVITGVVSSGDMDSLRAAADLVRDKFECGVVVLAAASGSDKVNFVAMATKQAVAKGIHSGNIVKEAAKVAGGGGGGRPDMAQAGGKNPSAINQALSAAFDVITNQIK